MANYRARLVLGVVAAGVTLLPGCASTPREVELPPQTLTDAPTSTTEAEAALVSRPAAPQTGEAAPSARTGSPATAPASQASRTTIVIQAAPPPDVTPQTLQQASATEQRRRASAEAPVAVITNRNLGELAEGGQITIIGGPETGGTVTQAADTAAQPAAQSAEAAASTAATPATDAGAAAPLKEEYWRSQALKLRLDWKAAVEKVDQLTSEVEELRRRFYEEDDPFYRDNQIKPAWDHTLDLLATAKTDAEAQARKVERFLEDGRKAGALPGWLREGIEFEPPPAPDRSPAGQRRSDDPWEPKILNEEPRNP